MENILWGLLSIYLILNNSMIKLITSMVQLRTSKKLYKFTHLIAILLVLIPVILVPYFIEQHHICDTNPCCKFEANPGKPQGSIYQLTSTANPAKFHKLWLNWLN